MSPAPSQTKDGDQQQHRIVTIRMRLEADGSLHDMTFELLEMTPHGRRARLIADAPVVQA